MIDPIDSPVTGMTALSSASDAAANNSGANVLG